MLPQGRARSRVESCIETTYTAVGRSEANVDCVPILLNCLDDLEDVQSSLFEIASHLKIDNRLESFAAIPLGGVLLSAFIRDSFLLAADTSIITVDTKRTSRVLRGRRPALRERVVMIDDVIGTGETMVRAINIMRLAGARVTDAIVLIDRGIGGRERLENNAVILHSVHELKVKS